MRHVADGNIKSLTLAGGAVILLLIFIAYRARGFHYCAGNEERPHITVAAGSQECGPGEAPMELRTMWREQGLPSKIKMIGKTIARAFVPD